jgi:hypothetical protein
MRHPGPPGKKWPGPPEKDKSAGAPVGVAPFTIPK